MPLYFKIFLLLFLQQGTTVLKNTEGYTTVTNCVTVFAAKNMTIDMEGENTTIEELLNQCTEADPSCDILEISNNTESTGFRKVQVSFKNLPAGRQDKIMKQLTVAGILINIKKQP